MAVGTQGVGESGRTEEAGTPERDHDASFEVDLGDLLEEVRIAYQYMEMPVERYLLLVLAPSFGFSLLVALGLLVLQPPSAVAGPMTVFAVFVPAVALVYPKIVQDRHRKDIRARFYLFITHITVLATTNIDRVEVFRTLANDEEYRAIAEEMGHIVAFIDTWNRSLEDACRMRGKHVPSPLMSDFLERLAYTVGAGQAMDDFLLSEQGSIIQDYAVRYESDLDRLAVLKDLYMSVILSATFLLVFATIIPFLIGIDPMFTISGVIVMYLFVQAVFVYLMNNVAPSDPVWAGIPDQSLPRSVRLRTSLIVGVGLSLLVAALAYALLAGLLPVGADVVPLPVYLAAPFTPLLIPGYVMRREEKGVKRRDEEFPSFIRSLGAIESVKQSSTSTVLTSLRRKDFGSLTVAITNLYRRLNMRIESKAAWTHFAEETGSNLIDKFSDMYVVGRKMGGEPRRLGMLISENFSEVLNLRKKRSQETGTIMGVVYGVAVTSSFAFFVGLEVIRVLRDITNQMDVGASPVGSLLHAEVYNIPEVQFLLFIAVLVNAFFSSLMIRVVDRGHSLTAVPHFVLLVWASALTGIVTRKLVGSLISV